MIRESQAILFNDHKSYQKQFSFVKLSFADKPWGFILVLEQVSGLGERLFSFGM